MWRICAGSRDEVRQLAQQYIEFYCATFHRYAFNQGSPACVCVAAEHCERALRVGIRDDNRGRDPLAAFEHYALAGDDLGDGNAACDYSACVSRCVAKVERDHAHPAAHVAPHAGHSAETAGCVMESDGGCAGVKRAGVGADYALAEVGRLQALVAEIALYEFCHRPVV